MNENHLSDLQEIPSTAAEVRVDTQRLARTLNHLSQNTAYASFVELVDDER